MILSELDKSDLKRMSMHYRILLSMVFVLLCMATSKTYAKTNKLVGDKLAFEQYKITVPFKVSLPIIAVDIATSSKFPADEIVVIGEDDQHKMWLAVYALDESKADFILLDKLRLENKYFAFDVSENQQGLYFLAKSAVVALKYRAEFDKENNLPAGLYLEHKQSINSIFLLNSSNFLTEKDFIKDINNDGFDDIILADFEQTKLWLYSKESQSYLFQALAIAPHTELIRDSINFEPIRVFFTDLTQDRKQDIAWIAQGKINYFRQTNEGIFATVQESYVIADTIQGLYWWQIRESDGESLDQSNLTHRAVEQLKDINGDGLVDIIVRFTKSSGVLERVNDYEFYFGYLNKDGQFGFAKTPNTVIQAEGTLTDLKIVDVNKDGKLEVLLSSFELSISNIIGALMSGGIDQNVLLFSLNDQGVYGEDAVVNKEVELSFSLTSGQSGEPVVILADVNNDDLQDLILSSGEEKLKIFLGQNSDRLFNKKASRHEILLPKNGALFKHHDINHDGNEDFIMSYGRLDDASMASKVTILIVK